MRPLRRRLRRGFRVGMGPGLLGALDLATGTQAWELPFGDKTVAGRVPATGTDDGFVRALDEDTGEVLWRHRMAAAGSAPPVTFTVDGRQYLAVVSTGGKFHNFVDRASRLYLFALPAG